MAVEIWVAAFGTSSAKVGSKQLIYRFSAATGNPVGTGAVSSSATADMVLGAPIETNHGGVLVSRAATVGCIAPAGNIIYSLNGSGVATAYGASGVVPGGVGTNPVTSGGSEAITSVMDVDDPSPNRKLLYVGSGPSSAEEWWVWDGSTGITQRFSTSGVRLTTNGNYFFQPSDTSHGTGVQTGDLRLAAGTDIAYVTTA